jgi:acyl homoserine lactone synthase
MLADVFSSILDGEPPLRSATLWESTRFCVDTERLGAGRGANSVSYATCELMVGSLEFAMQSGISDIITVIDPIMDRVLRRSDNAPYDYVGTTKPMGKVPAMAALLDCTEERIARVRRFAGITGNVFLDDEAALALIARGGAEPVASNVVHLPRRVRVEEPAPAAVSVQDVVDYCLAQLASATTDKERRAALEVVRAAASAVGPRRPDSGGSRPARRADARLH